MDIWTFINLLRSRAISEVVFTEHSKYRLSQRNLSEREIKKLLENKHLLRGIFRQRSNRFKLCYEIPGRGLDVIVVVDAKHIKSKLKITVVTAFLQPSERRTKVKEHEG